MVLITYLFLSLVPASCGYVVTIYPQFLSQNGRTRFDVNRWNGHNGLDDKKFIAGNMAVGSRPARWIHPDLQGGTFYNATEDPHRKGYPDPNYFRNPKLQESLCSTYADDVKGYAGDVSFVMQTKGKSWPVWMNTSLHGGMFPNSLDAGAEMVLLMVDAVYNYTRGALPPFFEVINEPDTLWQTVEWSTIVEYHKIVAQKLHDRYPGIKVGGPTYTGAIADTDQKDFSIWKNFQEFMDMSLEHLEFISFHPYNSFQSQSGTHKFYGINEARLVAVIDLIEGYSQFKTGQYVPLIPSEYGLGPVVVDPQTPASLVQWAYVFLHNAEMFTFLSYRGFVEQAVAFLLSHDSYLFGNASIFYPNGTETGVATAYRFWNAFNASHHFLRTDSPFNGLVRLVSPLAVIDSTSKYVTVLLHNFENAEQNVTLDFEGGWLQPTTALQTCLYLDSSNSPKLSADKTISLSDNTVNIPREGTCFLCLKLTAMQRASGR